MNVDMAVIQRSEIIISLTGDTRKIFVSNIDKTVDEYNSARVLVGCKPMIISQPSVNLLGGAQFMNIIAWGPQVTVDEYIY